MKIGVLALQGDFKEHIRALQSCGAETVAIRRASEIQGIDGLVLPGGESTTIAKLARSFGIFNPIQEAIGQGLPVYGSCAGMILLADQVIDAGVGQETFGGIEMIVRRNAFGRQVDSFESEIFISGITGPAIPGLFIRAPWVESLSEKVEVLASVQTPDGQDHAVAIRQGALLATSFHPEITGDLRIHQYFLDQVCKLQPSIK